MHAHEQTDEALLAAVSRLVGSHRRLTAKLVACLAEIEERRLHLLKGFSSMFDFCTKALGFSEGEAFRRILAARLGRRFPVVFRLLASGELNLTTLELLRDRLTEENHGDLFAQVAGKGKHDVVAILAARFPQPDRPSRVRRQRTEPLSGESYSIEFTASDALFRKLERCRDLMSHSNPSRDLGAVIERGLDLLLVELERKRMAKTRRARSPQAREECSERTDRRPEHRDPVASGARRARVTNPVRRAVFERDGSCCTFVASDGRRCDARAFLELDHIEPRARGGSDTLENLRVRCRAHNQLWAEQAFGREQVEQARHFRQQKSTVVGSGADLATLEKVRATLRSLGFREAQAREAVATVAKLHANERLTLERALREALLVAAA
jgi:hypothetical protein